MLKFRAPQENGRLMIGLVLEEENIKRIREGKPIFIGLDAVGIEGVDIFIDFGEKQAYMDKLTKAMHVKEFRDDDGNIVYKPVD